MDTQTIKFQELWDDFVSSFKGLLITESQKQEISFAIAKLSLIEVVSTWSSEYTVNGRWLRKLIQEEPEKGKLVQEILTKDISLTEIKLEQSRSNGLKYIIPLGAGAIGCGIAYMTKLATIGTACATLIPIAVAYPLTTAYLLNRKDIEKERIINNYVSQLNKYKESVISILLV